MQPDKGILGRLVPRRGAGNVNLEVQKGEFLALMGSSGSGNSTLLHLVAAIDLGRDLAKLSERAVAEWRDENVGFIFRQFNLIPLLTALENVELSLKLTRLKRSERREQAATALKLVGLGNRLKHLPRQLSGGQEQRVAIARAIVSDPAHILADEPTGDLDAGSTQEVLTILGQLNRDFGKSIVMVIHDPHAARFATRVHHLEKGELKAVA
jgi:putative ABC transport system ATP-binding protein